METFSEVPGFPKGAFPLGPNQKESTTKREKVPNISPKMVEPEGNPGEEKKMGEHGMARKGVKAYTKVKRRVPSCLWTGFNLKMRKEMKTIWVPNVVPIQSSPLE